MYLGLMRGVSDEVVTWSDERFPFRIECSPALLAAIDDEVCEGFAAAPGGGLERGGVLFGKVAGGLVSILEYRPVASDTPDFAVTGETEANLRKLLPSKRRSGNLRGLAPVGWYRSCTRTHIRLTETDVAAFRRWFPQPSQVALVLRPDRTGPTRAAFFFREADGTVNTASAYEEFAIPRPDFDIAAPAAQPFTGEDIVPRPPSRWWLWPLAALLLLLPFVSFIDRTGAPPPARGIGLQLFDSSGQMRISWDQQSGPVLQASAAKLEIHEGQHATSIDLDAGELLLGRVYYWRSSGPTRVRMVLFGPGGEVEESAELPLSTPDPLASALPASALAGPAPPEPDPLPAAVDLAERLPSASREIQVPEPEPAPPARTPPRAFRFSAAAHPPAAPRPQAITAPPPVGIPAGPGAGSPPVATHVPEAPPRPPAPPPPQPRTPASGQIIWTGRLPRRGVVHIEGGKASQGYLSAALPGALSSVTVLPGEMTPAGLRLYTADPRLAGRTESPGPQNGWNQTEYVWDPVRAGEISVLEAPVPQNGWKRLVMRSETRNYSVVVLRWEAP